MSKPNVFELWRSIKASKRLTSSEVKTILFLFKEFNLRRIERTQLIASVLRLLEKDQNLHQRFTEICTNHPQQEKQEEDEDTETRNDQVTEIRRNHRRDDRKDETSHHHLEVVEVEDEDEDAETRNNDDDLEEGEIRELDPKSEYEANHHHLDENSKDQDHGDQKIEEDKADLVEIRVDIDENKKKGFHVKDRIDTSLKKRRRSKRLEVVTPSYKHIPEEEQYPSDEEKVLNNKYASVYQLKEGENWGRKKQTKYEEAMTNCEDEMFEIDRWIGTLSDALKNGEDVMSGKIRLEDIGITFYICIKEMYGGLDMAEIVKGDYQKALPVIIRRLKQKLNEATLVRESLVPHWKQVFEENTAKQRDFSAKVRKRK